MDEGDAAGGELSERETATILIALRYLQGDLAANGGHVIAPEYRGRGRAKLLGAEEIDALCERLNVGRWVRSTEV
jgi:hypothetical protein